MTQPRPPSAAALFRTSTFRIAVLYLVLFAGSALTLLAFVYATTAGFMARQTDETIQAEITGLDEQYRRWGLIGLTRLVIERSRNQRHSLYLLADPAGKPMAGNLDSWPSAAASEGGWIDFTYDRPMGEGVEDRAARARTFVLRGGFQLLVGRDVAERHELDALLRSSLAWAGAITIGLGLLGGILMSRNALKRIEAINRAARDIMAGDLARRIPLSGSGDEMDRLAENLNAMLDQIEELMTAMREVTDNIAHDLRSPLSRLRSRLEVTLMQPASVDAYGEALQATIEEAERLLATFNALLDIARAEAGAERQAMSSLDLAPLARGGGGR
ncbi:MAG: HAMP domain-containing protein [Alphaproteobacteria bacterium]